MKFLLALCCSLWPCLLFTQTLGAPPIPGLEKQADSQELKVKMWSVPILPGQGVARDRPPEEVPENQPPGDARPWFESNGIPFAKGEEAFFDERLRVLMVHAKAATIEKIDKMARDLWPSNPVQFLRIEFTFAEFSSAKAPYLKGNTAHDALLKAAGDSWHVLNQIQVAVRSGSHAAAISRLGDSPAKAPAPAPEKNPQPAPGPSVSLRPGETGATVEVEAVLSPNEKVVDLNFVYHFRAPGNPPWNWKTSTSLVTQDGRPLVVQMESGTPDADHAAPGKSHALVVRADVVRLQNAPALEGKSPAAPSPQP